jgi:uncharacterized protein YjbJ (UPF0337 family)
VVFEGLPFWSRSRGSLSLSRASGPMGRPFRGSCLMKWYQLASDWRHFTAMVKEEWDKLTDDDLTTFGGQSDQLAGLLQQKYGYSREQAEKSITEFSQKIR